MTDCHSDSDKHSDDHGVSDEDLDAVSGGQGIEIEQNYPYADGVGQGTPDPGDFRIGAPSPGH